MKNNIFSSIFKGIALLLVNIITLLLVFSVWALVNLPLFLWALAAVLTVLITLDAVILLSALGKRQLGIPGYTSIAVTTVLFYGFVMIYTGLSYAQVTIWGFIIAILIATAVYLSTVSGLILSGLRNKQDKQRQQEEQAKALDVKVLLMAIKDSINSKMDLPGNAHSSLADKFSDLEERIAASTPFGRVTKPAVVKLEAHIFEKLAVLQDCIVSLTMSEEPASADKILELMADVKAHTINREKLILH